MRSVAPFPRKVEHEFGEPAYSLLVRTLSHNGSRRIGPAIDGVIGAREKAPSRWDPTEIARICKAAPEAVRHATPVVGTKTAEVMGQTLLAEHVGNRTRRWCPTCMKGQAFHRVWWDVLPVTSCPEHGIKLTVSCGCKRRSLQWRSGSLRHCPAGHLLEGVACTEAEPDVLAFDAYVVARLRGEGAERQREFDDIGLGELIAVCERLGKASFDEGRTIYTIRETYGIGRVHAEGFRILRGLPDTFDDLLGRIRCSEASLKQKSQLRRAYGGLYDFVREMPAHSVGSVLRQILAEHVRRNLSIRSGMRLDGRTPLVAGRMVLTAAADALGILPERLMDLLDQLDIPWERRGRAFEMSEADFETLKARLDGSQSLKQVADALHVSGVEVAGLASAGLLDVIAAGRGAAGWIFPANAAANLIAKLRARAGKPGPLPTQFVSLPLVARRLRVSVAEALPPIFNGSVEVRARWAKRYGLSGFRVDKDALVRHFANGEDAGVTLAVAARRLGLSQKTMDAAVTSALLRTQTVEDVHRVTFEEIERFHAAWAPVRELRRTMGVTAWMPVAAALSRAEVNSPLTDCPFTERVYPREDAVRACTAAAPTREHAAEGTQSIISLAIALNLPPPMAHQLIEAGLIATGEGCAFGGVPDQEIERFKEAVVSLSELCAAFGLTGSRAALSILDKAGVPAVCRRPKFYTNLFPRREAFDALCAWSQTKAGCPSNEPPDEPLLTIPDVAARLGTDPGMVRLLTSNALLASTRKGWAIMVPISEVERFSRKFVFANELARLARGTYVQGVGAAFTKVMLRNGIQPVCSRPKFTSYVFQRDEAIEAVARLGLS